MNDTAPNDRRTPEKKKEFNPFYALLIVAGVAFCLTAFLYSILCLRELRPEEAVNQGPLGTRLMSWLDDHGLVALLVEVAVIAILTVAAIATDEYWTKRSRAPMGSGPDDGLGKRNATTNSRSPDAPAPSGLADPPLSGRPPDENDS